MSELLASPERRAPAAGARAVGLAAATVLAAALLALPGARVEPPQLTADPTGISTSSGRLRVWLALRGPAGARVVGVEGRLPGAAVEADGLTDSFSPRGVAAVRLAVEPRCPDAVAGLDEAGLSVAVEKPGSGRRDVVEVPFSTAGLLADAVRARCNAVPTQPGSAAQPVVRAHRLTGEGAVRVRVRLTAAGSTAQEVTEVLGTAGVQARPVDPLPVRVPRGQARDLLVDLRPEGCGPLPGRALLRLRYAGTGPVVPRVDGGVRARLQALRPDCPATP